MDDDEGDAMRVLTTPAAWAAAATVTLATIAGGAGPAVATGHSGAGDAPPLQWQTPIRVNVLPRTVAAAGDDGFIGLSERIGSETATEAFRSTDGVDWAAVATIPDVALAAVAAGPTGYVAVGSAGGGNLFDADPVVATSPDVVTWQTVELPTGSGQGGASDVVRAGDGFLVVGYARTGAAAVAPTAWTSTDGTTWSQVSPDAFDTGAFGLGTDDDVVLAHVALVGSTAVAVGVVSTEGGPGRTVSWSSRDGREWTPLAGPEGADALLFSDLAAGPAGAVLVGAPDLPTVAQAWRTDGGTWEGGVELSPLSDGTDTTVEAVAASGTGFLAVGSDLARVTGAELEFRAAVWWSPDGETWTRVAPEVLAGPALGPDATARQVVTADGRWYVYGLTTVAEGRGLRQPVVWVAEDADPTSPTSTASATTVTGAPTTSTPGTTPPVPTAVPAGAGDTGPGAADGWRMPAVVAAAALLIMSAVGLGGLAATRRRP